MLLRCATVATNCCCLLAQAGDCMQKPHKQALAAANAVSCWHLQSCYTGIAAAAVAGCTESVLLLLLLGVHPVLLLLLDVYQVLAAAAGCAPRCLLHLRARPCYAHHAIAAAGGCGSSAPQLQTEVLASHDSKPLLHAGDLKAIRRPM